MIRDPCEENPQEKRAALFDACERLRSEASRLGLSLPMVDYPS